MDDDLCTRDLGDPGAPGNCGHKRSSHVGKGAWLRPDTSCCECPCPGFELRLDPSPPDDRGMDDPDDHGAPGGG